MEIQLSVSENHRSLKQQFLPASLFTAKDLKGDTCISQCEMKTNAGSSSRKWMRVQTF